MLQYLVTGKNSYYLLLELGVLTYVFEYLDNACNYSRPYVVDGHIPVEQGKYNVFVSGFRGKSWQMKEFD